MTEVEKNIVLRRCKQLKEQGIKKWHKIYTILLKFIDKNTLKKRWILLDELHVEVSSFDKEKDTERTEIFHEFVDMMCELYFSYITCARTNQRINKVIQVLCSTYHEFVISTLSKKIDVILNNESCQESLLQKIFILVDSWSLGRSCIEGQLETTWLQVLSSWSKKMIAKVEESNLTNIVNYQHILLLVIKISLQMFQHFSVKIQQVTLEDNPQAVESRKNVKVILTMLMAVLFSKNLPKECLLLSGTSLSLFFNIEASNSKVMSVICQVLECAGMEFPSCVVRSKAVVNGVDMNLPPPDTQPITLIALLQAFITSTRKDVILQQNSKEEVFLTDILFRTICQICKTDYSPIVYYLSYEAVRSWMQRVKNLIKEIHQVNPSMLFGVESCHTNSLLDLVLESLENPVDGVSTSGRAIFGLLLEIHNEEKHMNQDNIKDNSFYGSLLDKVLVIPWQVKAKYGLLCEMLPYISIAQMFDKNLGLLQEMAACLQSNQLSSACTELFKALLLKSRQSQYESFQDNWISTLVKLLASNNQLLAQHTRQYWLPCALKHEPDSLNKLLNQLTNGTVSNSYQDNYRLSAKLAILKVARSLGILDSTQLDKTLLEQALQHQEDDLRLDALGVLCCDVKTSKPIGDVELQLLREFLPYNLNIACPSFRQELLVSLKKVLCRIRDNSLFCLKKNYPKIFKNPEVQGKISCQELTLPSNVELAFEFVDWVFNLMCNSLLPGANYQRQKTALEFLFLMFNTFSAGSNPNKRKEQPTESCRVLMNVAGKKGFLNFYSSRSAHVLLGCLQSSHSDIRELACGIMQKQFPTPFKALNETTSDTDFAVELMKEAIMLICSAKAQECESGSILCELLFVSYAAKLRWCFTDVFGKLVVKSADQNCMENEDFCIQFLMQLVLEGEKQLDTAKKDLSLAAEEAPIHGILLTLCRCITSYLDVCNKPLPKSFDAVVERIVRIALDVIDYLLGVLSRKQDSQSVVCGASFASLGDAISDAISTTTDIGKSEQHQKEFIMSCCFLGIKFGCHLLSSIVERIFAISHKDANSRLLLSIEILTSIGDMFIKIFTQCRLTGILLSCKLSLLVICRCFSGCDVPCLYSLPRQWIQNINRSISGEGAASSVTRRSAGLPVLVASIVSCETPSKKPVLVKYCIEELLKISFQPTPGVINQTTDLPQVHAMNILRSLYQDTALGIDVIQFIEQGFISAVNGFASPLWSIRNAATQLFGSLVLRTLGHKRGFQDENQINAISARDFFKRFLSLREFLLEKLNSSSSKKKKTLSQPFLKPELFPILTLLSKLRPASCDVEKNLLADFVPVLTPLASNSVYAVRSLAAKALVPFIPVNHVFCKAAELLRSLPVMPHNVSQNRVHGTLLQVHRLIDSINNPHTEDQELLMELVNRSWLGTSANACAVTRAEYITLVMDVSLLVGSKENYDLRTIFKDFTADATCGISVGSTFLQRAILLVKTKMRKDNDIDTHADTFKKDLHCLDRETRIATLESLNELANHFHTIELEESLASVISAEKDQQCLLLSLECFINVKRDSQQIPTKDSILWNKLLSYAQGSCGTNVQSKTIIALSILLRSVVHRSSDMHHTVSMVTDWSYWIKECSLPNKPEQVRNGAALGLGETGAEFLIWVQQYKEGTWVSSIMQAVMRIFQASIMLLVDEQEDIRIAASIFGSKIHNYHQGICNIRSVTCSVSMEMIFEYIAQSFYWSSEIWASMMELIRGHSSVADVLSDYEKSRCILFEQEDCNLYAEPFVTMNLACKYFKVMVDLAFSKESAITSASRRAWPEAFLETELNHVTTGLRILKNKGIQDGGSLQNPKLFTLRYRLVLVFDVIRYLSATLCNPATFHKANLSQLVNDVIMQVNKNSTGCHPSLLESHTKGISHRT